MEQFDYWLWFFLDAGFPLAYSTKYARVFTNECFERLHLKLLNENVLEKLGISLRHQLIILDHARKISREGRREIRALNSNPNGFLSRHQSPSKIKSILKRYKDIKVLNKAEEMSQGASGSTPRPLKEEDEENFIEEPIPSATLLKEPLPDIPAVEYYRYRRCLMQAEIQNEMELINKRQPLPPAGGKGCLKTSPVKSPTEKKVKFSKRGPNIIYSDGETNTYRFVQEEANKPYHSFGRRPLFKTLLHKNICLATLNAEGRKELKECVEANLPPPLNLPSMWKLEREPFPRAPREE